MARYGSFLYRRNGRYYARLRVPAPLRGVLGKTHLRASLDTTDYHVARLRVHETILAWKRQFSVHVDLMNPLQVVAGSALLHGAGQLTLESAARECGLTLDELVQEVKNHRVKVRVLAQGWWGSELRSELEYNELEFDSDGSFVVNCADGHDKVLVAGLLYVRRAALAVASGDTLQCSLFFRDEANERAVVFPQGIEVPIASLLIEKADAESIRASMASTVTPTMIKLATASMRFGRHGADAAAAAADGAHGASAPTLGAHIGVPLLRTAASPSALRASDLVQRYLAAKDADWSEATRIQMRGFCQVFIELMEDPQVERIDRALLSEYRTELMTLPAKLHLARRRHPEVKGLVELAKLGIGPRMRPERADIYVAKLGEAFGWAAREGLMNANPAAGMMAKKRRKKRQQDERNAFTPQNLDLIFSAACFLTGKGERTATGKHWGFQPHMYWLPLLALYAGGRLNELSQLYLADVKRDGDSGPWYLDFNLDAPDKLDIDEPDADASSSEAARQGSEKRLKTINAERKVPLHSELLRLGFMEYVAALAARGEQRLFPELRFDHVKGYGKQAGQWFNERFLGKKLKIKRDGMQTFHSFRHNFTTALTHLGDPPLGEFVINHLTGHERGHTMSAQRYAKDLEPDKMVHHVNRIRFELPAIASMAVEDALEALDAALERKQALKPTSGAGP
jgi:integrase